MHVLEQVQIVLSVDGCQLVPMVSQRMLRVRRQQLCQLRPERGQVLALSVQRRIDCVLVSKTERHRNRSGL